ncbi:hypothetical protein F5148DRAFT_1178045 [Russula earlei]|uniref:Uncharacterized protein n=1 Tax=Russula earlei TaxID=71964 RepID=A0ACC0UG81_9AGAM|nr:hypothetical protein F5148DRAFT_1178045 [Russula earlei]
MRCYIFIFFFLLVTTLPLHLAHAALPSRSSSEDDSPFSVAWSYPAPGDRFGPGDVIMGEWKVTGPKVVSPSFRLCAGGEGSCGATVWPEVVAESGGSYTVNLTAPNVTTESAYYLQMKDDFDHSYSSPIFNLTPTSQLQYKPASRPPEVAQPRPDQAPMSSSTSAKSKDAATSDPAAPAAAAGTGPADPGATLFPPSAAGIPSNAAATGTPGNSGGGGPLVAAAHGAPPTAALAVPLSLAGAIVLLAGGLALHHRRKLAAEKERCYSARHLGGLSAAQPSATATMTPGDASDSALRRMRSVGLALDLGEKGGGSDGYDDAEKALFARAALFGSGRGRLPDHASSYTAASRAAEPRQRTRHFDLDLLPREYTARPCAHSTSRSSHSQRRGLLGVNCHRHVRHATASSSSSSDHINGGRGSLWRSLSVSRRKNPPTLPLTSPAMTESTTSVTSEVLSSYLPSPNYALASGKMREGHRTSIDDLGFENIPLSPLPLPLLHTRGEAAESDDPRMRELRGVYEAVARALGTIHRV